MDRDLPWLCETREMEPKTITLVRSDALSRRAPYAYAAMPPVGARLVFTAGACPLDPGGETVAPGDVAAQAEQVMKNLRAALRAAGADLDNVLKTTVYVATQTAGGSACRVGGREAPLRQPRRTQHAARSQRARLPRPTGRSRSSGSSSVMGRPRPGSHTRRRALLTTFPWNAFPTLIATG